MLAKGSETKTVNEDTAGTVDFQLGDFDFSAISWTPYTGTEITTTNVSVTGMGILGGIGLADSFHSGKETTILASQTRSTPKTEDETPAATAPAATNPAPAAEQGALRVVVTEKDGYYELAVFSAAGQIFTLGVGTVTVRMTWQAPADAQGDVYAVFCNADGSLRAIPGRYDPQTGALRFDSPLVGDFVVVCFAFDGEPFTPAFYEALGQLDAVRRLQGLG